MPTYVNPERNCSCIRWPLWRGDTWSRHRHHLLRQDTARREALGTCARFKLWSLISTDLRGGIPLVARAVPLSTEGRPRFLLAAGRTDAPTQLHLGKVSWAAPLALDTSAGWVARMAVDVRPRLALRPWRVGAWNFKPDPGCGLTLPSRGCPKGCAFCVPLMSNVSRRTSSAHRGCTDKRHTLWYHSNE